MDASKKTIMMRKIETAIKQLQKNNMLGFYVEHKEEVVPKIRELIKDGDTVAVGGSMTLFECGVIDFLRSGNYNFLDRYEDGLTRDETFAIFRQSLLADTYLGSTNALTENGELYNVDGNGNRIAAYAYGPKSVILVCG